MACCTGCSFNFSLLLEGHCCGGCKRQANGGVPWPQCTSCGDAYEFLRDPKICGNCENYTGPDGAQERVKDSISQPANPRTHSSHRPSPQDNEADRLLKLEAARITNSMATSHSNAVARAGPGARVAPSKLRGAHPPVSTPQIPSKPEKKINVRIDKLCNYGNGKGTIGAPFVACILEYKDSTPMDDVLEQVRHLADEAYTSAYDHRVWSIDDIVLMFSTSKTRIDAELLSGSLGDLWRAISSNPTYVKPAEKKANRLETYIIVKYPQIGGNNDDSDFDKTTVGLKSHLQPKGDRTTLRNDSRSLSCSPPPTKKSRISASGSAAYSTHIDKTPRLDYTTEKLYLAKDKDTGQYAWTRSSKLVHVSIEKEPFAFGSTKNAFKMRIGGLSYAAKRFYDIGGSDLSGDIGNDENLSHLQDELRRQGMASLSVSSFLEHARELKISVYDLHVENAFILEVSEGSDVGQAWIVDPLYENATKATRKFSGTDRAGNNTGDLIGRTCDAFAHFSYFDSGETAVFSDIQGIDTYMLPIKSRRKGEGRRLILFDLMVHSEEKDFGLGDRGPVGLSVFSQQHKCNSICEALGLDPLSTNVSEKCDNDDESDKSRVESRKSPVPAQGTGENHLDLDYTSCD